MPPLFVGMATDASRTKAKPKINSPADDEMKASQNHGGASSAVASS